MAQAHTSADLRFMQLALRQAQVAAAAGEVPVGAVVVRAGQVIATGHNSPLAHNDPTAHAEMNAMRAAAHALGNYRLDDCTLYVTLEPCAMCSGAALHARFRRVVFGASEPKTGAGGSVLNVFANPVLNHQTDLTGGVMAAACARVMQDFFTQRRAAQQRSKVPLRDDALRPSELAYAQAWELLGLAPQTSRFSTTLPALQGLRLHWLDNRTDMQTAPHVYLHDLEGWSAQFAPLLNTAQPVVALDLPGFGLSDKPKKLSVHRIDWHNQVLREFLAYLHPAVPAALHAPHEMAPLLQGLSLPIHAVDTIPLPPALLALAHPDRGHEAGPRALKTLLRSAPA